MMADEELGEARVSNRTSVTCPWGHGPHRVQGRGPSESTRQDDWVWVWEGTLRAVPTLGTDAALAAFTAKEQMGTLCSSTSAHPWPEVKRRSGEAGGRARFKAAQDSRP